MKINQINSMTYSIGFGRTAVPYPEYPAANHPASFGHTASAYPEYINAAASHENRGLAAALKNKLHSLFSPEITRKSEEIKKNINDMYDRRSRNYAGSNRNTENQLLAVLA